MLNTRRAFLAIPGIALLAAGVGRTAEAEQTAEETANLRLVESFCASWSTRDLKQILPRLSADCIYRMSEATPPVTGHAGVTEKLGSWMPSSNLGIEFRILETFACGPIVINRRVDSFRSSTRPLTWEGIGVFYIRDGLIREWSDYTTRVTTA